MPVFRLLLIDVGWVRFRGNLMGAESNAEQCGAQQTIYPINAGMQQTNGSEEEGNDDLILLDIII